MVDFLVNNGDCVEWYGTILDAVTGQPVSGATVSLTFANWETLNDGVYRLHFGCPAPSTFPPFGTGTTFGSISAPGYQTQQIGTRREFIRGMNRTDYVLNRIPVTTSRSSEGDVR